MTHVEAIDGADLISLLKRKGLGHWSLGFSHTTEGTRKKKKTEKIINELHAGKILHGQ